VGRLLNSNQIPLLNDGSLGVHVGLNPWIKPNIAQLLESEAQWMINGRSMSATDYLKERYTDSLAVKDLAAASRYLEKLISVMSFEIKKKHC
jgi:hypothetical protein